MIYDVNIGLWCFFWFCFIRCFDFCTFAPKDLFYVVVSNIYIYIHFLFHPYLGKIPILTDIFSTGLKPPTSFTYMAIDVLKWSLSFLSQIGSCSHIREVRWKCKVRPWTRKHDFIWHFAYLLFDLEEHSHQTLIGMTNDTQTTKSQKNPVELHINPTKSFQKLFPQPHYMAGFFELQLCTRWFNLTFSSLHPLVGGHDSPFQKVTFFTIPKRSPAELPGRYSISHIFAFWSTFSCIIWSKNDLEWIQLE